MYPDSIHQEQNQRTAAGNHQSVGYHCGFGAEQIYNGPGRGEEKKAYVLQ